MVVTYQIINKLAKISNVIKPKLKTFKGCMSKQIFPQKKSKKK